MLHLRPMGKGALLPKIKPKKQPFVSVVTLWILQKEHCDNHLDVLIVFVVN